MAFAKEGRCRSCQDCGSARSVAGAFPALASVFVLSACGGGGGAGDDFVFAQADVEPALSRFEAEVCAGVCTSADYFGQLAGHSYLSGRASPQQMAFAGAGFDPRRVVSRRSRAHLVGTGAAGESARDLLARIGVTGRQFTYIGMAGTRPSDIAGIYASLAADGLVDLSHAADPFFVAAAASDRPGISSSELAGGAWVLAGTGTGTGGGQDPLAALPSYRASGIREAAATGKAHFYYGLNRSLDGRAPEAGGCRHIEEACIGAPHRFTVELRNGRVSLLVGNSASFAFATYLLAWERMPEHAEVAAVFDLARSCVEDLGEAGADADTGLGRLDIGCMARGLTRLPECAPGQVLVSVSSCRHLSYWKESRDHYYLRGNASPQQQALAAAGIEGKRSDRRDRAYLLDGGSHAGKISDLLARFGVGASSYSYLEMAVPESGPVSFSISEIARRYLSLSASDFVNFSFDYSFVGAAHDQHVGIRAVDVEDGAWILNAVGNDGSQDSLALFSQATRDGTLEAMRTGKVHFYYGLDRTLTGRHSASNGCLHIEEYCIGAPYEFFVQLRDGLFRIGGTSYSAPFGFATYLLAWERMPARTDIAAVFDLALACVQDIGAAGADADTGRGRLDIGCMAYGATQMPECPSGTVLTGMTGCTSLDYWKRMQGLASLSGSENALRMPFRDAGLAGRISDRRAAAFLLAGPDLESSIIAGAGISAGQNYTRVEAAGASGSTVYLQTLALAYGSLQSSDFIGLPQARWVFTTNRTLWPALTASQVEAGAWMVLPVGSGGSVDPFAGAIANTLLVEFMRASAIRATATGKVHFFYGLNADLDGRHPQSDGCQDIEEHCLGVPYRYYLDAGGGAIHSGSSAAAAFGFAAYLLTWERLPEDATIADVFAIGRACAEDLGEAGPDADTGRGRLDIGCLARRAHAAGSPPRKQEDDLEAYMDEFAGELFANELGRLSLPGRTDAGVKVGFGGDSFSATYRPASGEEATAAVVPAFDYVPLRAGFGVLIDGERAGAYLQPTAALRAGFAFGSAASFFGGRGSGEFAFACVRQGSLLLAADLPADAAGSLVASGWLQEARAGCIGGALLDRLAGRQAGVALAYELGGDDWRLAAQAWASRFMGGEVSLAGRNFALAAGQPRYGGSLQVSYSF